MSRRRKTSSEGGDETQVPTEVETPETEVETPVDASAAGEAETQVPSAEVETPAETEPEATEADEAEEPQTEEEIEEEIAEQLGVDPSLVDIQGDVVVLHGEAADIAEAMSEGEEEDGDGDVAEPAISFDEYAAMRGIRTEFDRARFRYAVGGHARTFTHWEDARVRVLGG